MALWFSGIEKPGKNVDEKVKSKIKPETDKAIKYFRYASRGASEDYANSALAIMCQLLIKGNEYISPDSNRLKLILEEENSSGNKHTKKFLSKYFS